MWPPCKFYNEARDYCSTTGMEAEKSAQTSKADKIMFHYLVTNDGIQVFASQAGFPAARE
jgi:hypothetical protein